MYDPLTSNFLRELFAFHAAKKELIFSKEEL
jgi:hypothetical protein